MHATDTLRENFLHWHKTLLTTHELAVCQARAMAPLLAEAHRTAGSGINALRHAVLDILGEAEDGLLSLQNAITRLAFCEAFLAAHGALADELMLPPAEERPHPQREDAPRLAMMHAAVSEQAKAKLAPYLGDTVPLYCNSFTELCETIAYGQAELALLPVENTTEGILRRSYDLIERFELHIACTVDYPTPDGGLTRTALLYQAAKPSLSLSGEEELLECRIAGTDGKTLTELLTVADACAMTLKRIDTHAAEDGEPYQHAIFRTGGREQAFATYLALFIPRTVITAKYTHFH